MKKFNIFRWLTLFSILTIAIPFFTFNDLIPYAKISGILLVISTTVAIRKWMYLLKKSKNRPEKIQLNINDRYFLKEHVSFYSKLNTVDRKTFEDRIGLFLSDIIVTEIGKEIPEREVCLLVASSAVITFWGLPYWNYGRLSEVLVYPSHFDKDNSLNPKGNVLGKVHQAGLMNTTMILSRPALEHGFKNNTDKKNVGIHEFAHLLDKASGEFDGFPFDMNEELQHAWEHQCAEEIKEIQRGKSDINPYGGINEIEFFAVLVEYYKEQPEVLKRKYPELFEVLDVYFNTSDSSK